MNMKKKLATMGLSALTLGAVALTDVEQADAASWEARTVEEVRQDVNNLGQDEVSYTIQWGDTLGVIAKAADLPVNTLVEINEINNADLIIVGNTIQFSQNSETVTIEDHAHQEEKTYDVSENQVREVATEPIQDVQEQAAAENNQAAQSEEAVQEQPAPIVNEEPQAVETPAQEENVRTESVVEEAPVQEATQIAAVQTASTSSEQPATTSETAAKEEIAQRESNGSYSARNGVYIGRYQLHYTYLDGDYSPPNQERVAEEYVSSCYGSWNEALNHWNRIGWY